MGREARARRQFTASIAGVPTLVATIAAACVAGPRASEGGATEKAIHDTRDSEQARLDTASLYVVGHLPRYDATGTGDVHDLKRRIALIRELSFGGSRLAFEWSDIEPTRGRYEWQVHDGIVAELERAGLRAYGMLAYSPHWARPAGTSAPHRPVIDGSAARGDTAFAAFAARTARRYAGTIDRWEIWNEPNLASFWTRGGDLARHGPDPADYLALFRLARDSIGAANREARIATGGLASGDWTAPSGRSRTPSDDIPGHWFLRGMLERGLDTDAVAFHPYTREPPWEFGTNGALSNPVLDSAVAVLQALGRDDARLWITEWGVDRTLSPSDSVSRAWLAAGLSVLVCNPHVELTTIYALTDWRSGRRFGLLDVGGARAVNAEDLASAISATRFCP